MSHQPPSPMGWRIHSVTARLSSGSSARWIISSRKRFAFSSLSQNCRYASDSSRFFVPRLAIMRSRSTLRAANSQQRPLWRWLVTSPVGVRLTE